MEFYKFAYVGQITDPHLMIWIFQEISVWSITHVPGWDLYDLYAVTFFAQGWICVLCIENLHSNSYSRVGTLRSACCNFFFPGLDLCPCIRNIHRTS